MGEVHAFSTSEVVKDTINASLLAYGLKDADGEEEHFVITKELKELEKIFKPGKPLSFSCKIAATSIGQS
ncbi:unnamed protein product [Choristocarpus tenellus]